MIGIIVAMEKEKNALSIENAREEKAGSLTFTLGTIENAPVVVAVCGIGKVFAAMCAQTMILRYAPSLLINCGVAGSLSPKLNVFDIAVGTGAVQYDMDTTPLGDPPGLISGLNIVEMPCDKALTEKLSSCANALGLGYQEGLIATADRFCASAADKEAILSHFAAVACEMEGGAVAQVATANSVPFCLFRAISDCADGSAPVSYDTFTVKAAENAGKLMHAFLRTLS